MPRSSSTESPRIAARRAAGGPAPAGVHPCVMGRAPLGVLRAARVPGGRRPEPGRLHPPLPALRALRRRTPDEGARAGGQRRLVRAGGARAGRGRARCARAAPAGTTGRSAEMLLESERVLASICEAIIGAAYLAFGFERTAPAVVESFAAEIEESLEHPVDYKSVLQERLARRAEVVVYRTVSEEGPAHDRSFVAVAEVAGRSSGAGRERPRRAPSRRLPCTRSTCWTRRWPADAPALDLHEGLQVLPAPDQARVRHRRVGDRRPERLGQVEHHRRRPVGARRAVAARGARADDEGRDLRRRPRRAGLGRGRGRGRDRQLRRPPGHASSPRSRSCAGWGATARASTG